jgi:hypothetical protein
METEQQARKIATDLLSTCDHAVLESVIAILTRTLRRLSIIRILENDNGRK